MTKKSSMQRCREALQGHLNGPHSKAVGQILALWEGLQRVQRMRAPAS